MASYCAINRITLIDRVILPGDTVSDGIDPIAKIQAQGGILYPLPNATISAAAAIALEHRRRGWFQAASDVMRSAMMSATSSVASAAQGAAAAAQSTADTAKSTADTANATANANLATLNALSIDGWDDLAFGPITQSTGNAGLTEDVWLGGTAKFLYMRHDQADSFTVEAQIPHRANTTQPIRPHLHVVPCAVGSGTIKLRGKYVFFRVGDAQPSYAAWTDWTASETVSVATDADFKHVVIGLFSATLPQPANVSAMLAIFIERDTSGTYTANKAFGVTAQANVRLASLDPHGKINRFGSPNEYGP